MKCVISTKLLPDVCRKLLDHSRKQNAELRIWLLYIEEKMKIHNRGLQSGLNMVEIATS